MLSVIWGYAFFWAAMPLLGWGRFGLEPSVTTCTIDWQHNDSNYKSFILVYFVLGFMVPLVIISVCYFAIARRLRRNAKQRGVIHDQWTNERSITLMSLVLIIAFLVAWTPYAVLCLWTIFSHPSTVPPFLTLIPPLFAKASTVFNPFIYFMSNPKLRADGQIEIFPGENDSFRNDLLDTTSVGVIPDHGSRKARQKDEKKG
ncbi:visual pigment-like receptor peropsin [Trichonephila inaurata madagascariensis]|uniref:Visual pigment-like receptor peropsin n=1 Tax=Trichonephila inaurata madagascariensis TaxID=2747483 RepID=A0A8X6WU88_9ARAC|nr:visual pigment-like receptor peropsin [Trichonephila inaurata madagascariensis]